MLVNKVLLIASITMSYPSAKAEKNLESEIKIDLETEQDETESFLKEIDSYEQQFEKIATEYIKVKERIISNTTLDNNVVISVVMKKPKKFWLESISAKIDEMKILGLSQDLGSVLQTTEFILYKGPIKSGEYDVAIKGRVRKKRKNFLAMAGDRDYLFDSQFKIKIPKGKVSKHWQIYLDVPDLKKYFAKAQIKNMEAIKNEKK